VHGAVDERGLPPQSLTSRFVLSLSCAGPVTTHDRIDTAPIGDAVLQLSGSIAVAISLLLVAL